ncbi:phosphoribosylformylglycinamidine cyclo-ligase [Candidatus Mesenet endosymbiont of Agriotes lineatus]|uniref:phosphoribosylformylglycinamidine cyclo-ligase n=1 Tax=Candidatus Mesenet endosymbiont of Agriotes lineatus TaxID=3077948 RepID=UPI0030CFFB56
MRTYLESGVNVELGNQLVKKIKPIAKSTFRDEVISDIGSFAALFDFAALCKKYKNPVLVSSTDGVGTKLLIAEEINKHDTIGIDLVAMCVNDVLAQGAEPLFFLDYFSAGSLDEDTVLSVISGIGIGCKEAKVALIGGETAEMPSMYKKGIYDLAGFAVGVVDKGKILPQNITAGDVIIGVHSSGIHSNGFSLVRSIIKNCSINYSDLSPWHGKLWGEILLEPTKIYVNSLLPIMSQIKGIAHITGGGLIDNIPRILPHHLAAEIDSWQWPEIFTWLSKEGKVEKEEMLKTFNCGIGMVLVIAQDNIGDVCNSLTKSGETVSIIGRIIEKPTNNAESVIFT